MDQYRSFVITMKNREDQAKSIHDRLSSMGSDVTIVEAVDGQLISDYEFSKMVGPRVDCFKSKHPMSKGELGCWLSHRRAWQKISEGPADFAFIFEDDVVINDDISPLAHALSEMDAWDVVKLYKRKSGRPMFGIPVSDHLRLTSSFSATSGTFAYAIKRQTAKRLLDSHSMFSAPIDGELRFRYRNRLKMFDLDRNLVEHDPNSCSIIEPHRSLKKERSRQKSTLSVFLCNSIHFFSSLFDNLLYLTFYRLRLL